MNGKLGDDFGVPQRGILAQSPHTITCLKLSSNVIFAECEIEPQPFAKRLATEYAFYS